MTVRYRVDSFLPGRRLASRTQVMDTEDGKRVAFAELQAGRVLAEVVALDTTGPWVVATYHQAAVAALRQREPADDRAAEVAERRMTAPASLSVGKEEWL